MATRNEVEEYAEGLADFLIKHHSLLSDSKEPFIDGFMLGVDTFGEPYSR